MKNRAPFPLALAVALIAGVPAGARAQILRDPEPAAPVSLDAGAPVDAQYARRAQSEFERFRLANLPAARESRPAQCDEQVGNVCYWYNEKGPPPPVEPPLIRQRKEQLISILDTVAMHSPSARWAAEQRVRFYQLWVRHEARMK